MARITELQQILFSEERAVYLVNVQAGTSDAPCHPLTKIHHSAVYAKALCRILELDCGPLVQTLKDTLDRVDARAGALREANAALRARMSPETIEASKTLDLATVMMTPGFDQVPRTRPPPTTGAPPPTRPSRSNAPSTGYAPAAGAGVGTARPQPPPLPMSVQPPGLPRFTSASEKSPPSAAAAAAAAAAATGTATAASSAATTTASSPSSTFPRRTIQRSTGPEPSTPKADKPVTMSAAAPVPSRASAPSPPSAPAAGLQFQNASWHDIQLFISSGGPLNKKSRGLFGSKWKTHHFVLRRTEDDRWRLYWDDEKEQALVTGIEPVGTDSQQTRIFAFKVAGGSSITVMAPSLDSYLKWLHWVQPTVFL